MSGRPPKPARLRILEGNRSKSPIPVEPKAAAGTPSNARGLDADERKAYRRFARDISSLGVLQVIDGELLRQLAIHSVQVERARVQITKYGIVTVGAHGQPVMNPAVTALNRSSQLLTALLSQCGLSPVARARLGTIETKPKGAASAPMDKIRAAARAEGA